VSEWEWEQGRGFCEFGCIGWDAFEFVRVWGHACEQCRWCSCLGFGFGQVGADGIDERSSRTDSENGCPGFVKGV